MNLIPIQYKLGALALVIVAAIGYHFWATSDAYSDGKKDGVKVGQAEIQAKCDKEDKAQLEDLNKRLTEALKNGEEIRAKLEKAQADYDQLQKRNSVDADKLADVNKRMQLALSKATRATAVRQAGSSSVTYVCTADAEVRELLKSCASRYVWMAGEADRAYASGLACEHAYDALRK